MACLTETYIRSGAGTGGWGVFSFYLHAETFWNGWGKKDGKGPTGTSKQNKRRRRAPEGTRTNKLAPLVALVKKWLSIILRGYVVRNKQAMFVLGSLEVLTTPFLNGNGHWATRPHIKKLTGQGWTTNPPLGHDELLSIIENERMIKSITSQKTKYRTR